MPITESPPINEVENDNSNLPMDTGGDTVSVKEVKKHKGRGFFKSRTKEEMDVIIKKAREKTKEYWIKKRLMKENRSTVKIMQNKVEYDFTIPTEEEMKLGLTQERKEELLKELSPALNAKDGNQFLEEHKKTLLEIKGKIYIAERELAETNQGKLKLIPLLMQYADRELRFGEIKFKLDSKVINNNIGFDMIKLKEAWNKINQNNQEIKNKEIEVRLL